jgi:hypothetical protein
LDPRPPDRHSASIRICWACPVGQCRIWALTRREIYGGVGGRLFQDDYQPGVTETRSIADALQRA